METIIIKKWSEEKQQYFTSKITCKNSDFDSDFTHYHVPNLANPYIVKTIDKKETIKISKVDPDIIKKMRTQKAGFLEDALGKPWINKGVNIGEPKY